MMLVVGTKPEHFEAVWVRNEWSRFLKFAKADRGKLLIPCYREMDAYDLPDEFAHLQAQDMSKIGFINDVVRGIRKVVSADAADTASHSGGAVAGTIAPLLRRIVLFLEDEEFATADNFCEQVLNVDPENAEAYTYKLLAEFRCRTVEDLSTLAMEIQNSKNYAKVIRFGTAEQAAVLYAADQAIRQNVAAVMQQKAEQERQEAARREQERLEQERREAELRERQEAARRERERLEQEELLNSRYYDVYCPHCREWLSYMRWQADENNNVLCPSCMNTFHMDFE